MTRRIDYVEGMDLWWVPTFRPERGASVQVLKVGRKWVSLSNGERVEIDGVHTEGTGSWSGTIWPTRLDHDAETAVHAAWEDLRRDIGRLKDRPEDMTIAEIDDIRRRVGLEVPERSSEI